MHMLGLCVHCSVACEMEDQAAPAPYSCTYMRGIVDIHRQLPQQARGPRRQGRAQRGAGGGGGEEGVPEEEALEAGEEAGEGEGVGQPLVGGGGLWWCCGSGGVGGGQHRGVMP